MSAGAAEVPEGSDAIQGRVHHEAPSDMQISIPEFPDCHPDLNGPAWQPTGGPNGTPFSIAIGRPGYLVNEKERGFLDQCLREMQDAPQLIIPNDCGDEEKEDAGPPHCDPVDGSAVPRKIGTTATGWEVWLNDKDRTYYYNRATSTTKYSWSVAEIEAEEQRFAQAANNSRNDNSLDAPLAIGTTKEEAQP